MDARANELERFKREINLTALAASEGFKIDRRASSRNSVVMRHSRGDKIIIARGHDQHWTYFNVHEAADCGTAIDFIARRYGYNLGEVRKHLRTWQGRAPLPAETYVDTLEPITRDLAAVRARYEATRPLENGQHAYLNNVRKLPALLLSRPQYAGRIRVDGCGNAVFPHWNAEGLCGFELRNASFRGFAKGGVKGLWLSLGSPTIDKLVLAESAIDALSYATLHEAMRLQLASVGGAMSPDQILLIVRLLQKVPGRQVVIATDNDEAGDWLATELESIFAAANRRDLKLVTDRPLLRGRDWNDMLKSAVAMQGTSPSPSKH